MSEAPWRDGIAEAGARISGRGVGDGRAPHGLWEEIALGAARESSLWAAALRPAPEREQQPVFSPLGTGRFALALETIYEGYLLHYGRPRLFAPADGDTAVLLGDYLYAHGLVRLAEHRDVVAVGDLAELISLCTQTRAECGDLGADGAAWAATAGLLGTRDPRLERARAVLRLECDPAALVELAQAVSGAPAVEAALRSHRGRVE